MSIAVSIPWRSRVFRYMGALASSAAATVTPANMAASSFQSSASRLRTKDVVVIGGIESMNLRQLESYRRRHLLHVMLGVAEHELTYLRSS